MNKFRRIVAHIIVWVGRLLILSPLVIATYLYPKEALECVIMLAMALVPLAIFIWAMYVVDEK